MVLPVAGMPGVGVALAAGAEGSAVLVEPAKERVGLSELLGGVLDRGKGLLFGLPPQFRQETSGGEGVENSPVVAGCWANSGVARRPCSSPIGCWRGKPRGRRV